MSEKNRAFLYLSNEVPSIRGSVSDLSYLPVRTSGDIYCKSFIVQMSG